MFAPHFSVPSAVSAYGAGKTVGVPRHSAPTPNLYARYPPQSPLFSLPSYTSQWWLYTSLKGTLAPAASTISARKPVMAILPEGIGRAVFWGSVKTTSPGASGNAFDLCARSGWVGGAGEGMSACMWRGEERGQTEG